MTNGKSQGIVFFLPPFVFKCSYSVNRCDSQHCESPISVTPLTPAPNKVAPKVAIVSTTKQQSAKSDPRDNNLYGELETDNIYTPLQAVELKTGGVDAAVATPHEYSIIQL